MLENVIGPKVLLAEDDENAAFLIKDTLVQHGFRVTLALDGKEAITAINTSEFDLALLDVMMPGKDGLELTKFIKSHYYHLPVVLLTARSLVEDKILGFQTGCDDYISKPFDVRELILRLEAVLRRNSIYQNPVKSFVLEDVTFDTNQNYIKSEELKISLTPTESKILTVFLQHMDRTLPRAFLQKKVWGASNSYTSRTFDVYLNRIRKILRQFGQLEIVNVHSLGFKLQNINE